MFRRLAENTVDGAIHQICMGWRHMWEMLVAGRKVYGELKNLCVWNKANCTVHASLLGIPAISAFPGSHLCCGRPDCVAGVVGLELRNVVANYPFERSRRFPESNRILATETIPA